MEKKKERLNKNTGEFDFVQMIKDKKRILKEADERRKSARSHQREKTVE